MARWGAGKSFAVRTEGTVVPYRKRIAEVQARIDAAIEQIDKVRAEIARGAAARRAHAEKMGKLLSSLARLKAERLRLMQHQLTHPRSGDA